MAARTACAKRQPLPAPDSKPGFKTRKAAEKYGQAQEIAADNGTYVDPRAGPLTLIEWVNERYPAQDLEPTALVNYEYAIEVGLPASSLPFGS